MTYILKFELDVEMDPSHLLEELQAIACGLGHCVESLGDDESIDNSCQVYDKDDEEAILKSEGYVKLEKVKKAGEYVVLKNPPEYIDMHDTSVNEDTKA